MFITIMVEDCGFFVCEVCPKATDPLTPAASECQQMYL